MNPDNFTFVVTHYGFEEEITVQAYSREGAWLKLFEQIDLGLVFGIKLANHEITE